MKTHRLMSLLLLLLLLTVPTVGSISADDTLEIRIYYSPTCSHCEAFRTDHLPQIINDTPRELRVVEIDVSTAAGLAELEAQETRLSQPSHDVPVIVIGDQLLAADQISTLDSLVRNAIGAAPASGNDTLSPFAPTLSAPDVPTTDAIIHIAYIERDGCSECARARLTLDALTAEFPGIEIDSFNHVTDAPIVEAMGEHMNLAEERRLIAPSIYVGSDAIIDQEIKTENVRAVLSQYTVSGAPAFWHELDTENGTTSIVDRFAEIGPMAVAGAGLIDGINPCAFATILFFVSYLAIGNRKRRDMLFVGLAFTLGVFITYYLVGIGLMQLMTLAATVHILAYVLYGLMAVVCLVLAVLNIRDYAIARQGRLHDMQTSLPERLREKIHLRIRHSNRAFIGTAFVTGIIVSLLELACTGQVYLPTISFVVSMDGMRTAGLLYLLIYNTAFVLPLLIVLGLAIYGLSTRNLQRWFTEHIAASKLVMAILFTVLGALLAIQLLALA